MKAMLLLFLVASPVVFFSYDNASFSTTGTWASTSSEPKHQLAFPQEVQIDCWKASHLCIEATAELSFGGPHINIVYLDIIKWDKDGILATSSTARCMTNKMIIAFADKSITAIDSPKQLNEEMQKACKFFGAYESVPPWIFIPKGSDRWEREHGIKNK